MPNTVPTQQATTQPQVNAQSRKPNENGTISVQAHMKIFDPATKKVYVEGRA
jgi:hypothetical protein